MAYGRWRLLFLLCSSLIGIAAVKSYYDILQVLKGSSDDQIKRAYRKVALKYHPDKNQGNEEANKKFTEINNGLKQHTVIGVRVPGMNIQDIFSHAKLPFLVDWIGSAA